MLEEIWSELTYNQKKEIGKYVLVFTGGVITGFVLNKVLEGSVEELNEKATDFRKDTVNQIDISELEEDINFDENDVEEYLEK